MQRFFFFEIHPSDDEWVARWQLWSHSGLMEEAGVLTEPQEVVVLRASFFTDGIQEVTNGDPLREFARLLETFPTSEAFLIAGETQSVIVIAHSERPSNDFPQLNGWAITDVHTSQAVSPTDENAPLISTITITKEQFDV